MVFQYGQKCTEQIRSGAEKCLGESTKFDQVISTKQTKARCLQVSGTALFLLVLALCLAYVCRHYLRDLLGWIENLQEWQGVLLFVVMFTLVSFPMTWGYIVLNVAGGYLYGFVYGLAVVFLSASCGVSISFIVCRRYMKDWVSSTLESENFKAVLRVVEGNRGYKVIALTRLTPIPFGLQNGLFAATNVKLPKYVITSSLGLLPTQALNAYMGSTLRSLEDVVSEQSGGYVILFAQVVIGVLLMSYVIRRARRELNKTCEESEKELQLNVVCNGDIEAQKSPPDIPKKSKNKFIKSHRKSHSASAILVNEVHSDKSRTA
ncbi:transmembrane protein 64 [Exaiptasia diaphana]|uniref:VTT domain-containing protein n=1 Tax=Exaiptasia diaphana TaxID=2652724 RepID=A0A913WS44_EXADI|nr:transmembrane protein 64 [Exaiptasia diaphana]